MISSITGFYRSWFIIAVFFSGLLLQSPLYAQEEDFYEMIEFHDLTLEEVYQIKMAVASNKGQTIRESPGIISIVTREEIANSGARDLIDVLRLVPGFEFCQDIGGLISLGSRGIWALDGKVLLLVDEQQYNEMFSGTLIFGNHFSVDQIDRIEVIRGPGSAKYGGHAGLAVIKIITKGAELSGVNASIMHGQQEGLNSRNQANVTFGNKYRDIGLSMSACLKTGDGTSTGDYTDFYGGSYSVKDRSAYDQIDFNFGLNYKDFDLRLIADRFNCENRSGTGTYDGTTWNRSFNSYFASLSYKLRLNDKLSLKPKFFIKQQEPHKVLATESDESSWPNGTLFYPKGRNLKGSLEALYDISENTNILAGAEYNRDKGEMLNIWNDPELADVYYDGEPDISYSSQSFFSQAELNSDYGNFIIGGRYDNHEEIGSKFVPRLAYTIAFEKLHFKLLYSQAFRLPDIEMINGATATDSDGNIIFDEDGYPVPGEVKHEEIEVAEAEIGYKIADNMSIAANFYNGTVDNPVVYRYVINEDFVGFNTYSNFGKIGTQGVEAEFRYRDLELGYVTIGYSYYQQTEKEEDATIFQAPGNNDYTIAMPAHKITLNGSYKVNDKLRVNPSFYYISKRYGYNSIDQFGLSVLESFNPSLLVNLFINYEFKEGFKIGLGVYDLAAEGFDYIQPYDAYHAIFPGPSREFIFKLSYNYHDK